MGTEKTSETETKEIKEKSVWYSKSYARSQAQSIESEQLITKVDPGEIITIDTLATLSRHAKDIADAKNGDIIKMQADIFLMDKPIFDLMMPNIGEFMKMNAPKHEHKNINKMASLMKRLFESIRFDPIVFASMESGVAIGSIKDEYLSESITSFHLKHGKDGLSNMYILGIKESGSESMFIPEDGLVNGAMEFSNIVRELIVPINAHIFTTLAIYREIISENE